MHTGSDFRGCGSALFKQLSDEPFSQLISKSFRDIPFVNLQFQLRWYRFRNVRSLFDFVFFVLSNCTPESCNNHLFNFCNFRQRFLQCFVITEFVQVVSIKHHLFCTGAQALEGRKADRRDVSKGWGDVTVGNCGSNSAHGIDQGLCFANGKSLQQTYNIIKCIIFAKAIVNLVKNALTSTITHLLYLCKYHLFFNFNASLFSYNTFYFWNKFSYLVWCGICIIYHYQWLILI